MESHVRMILGYSPVAKGHAAGFFRNHGALLAELCETAAMRRLAGVSQLAPKRGVRGVPVVMVPLCGREMGKTISLDPFSRYDHSLDVCAITLALASYHGLPFYEMRDLAVAALLHDVGHAPFSHTMEWIIGRHDIPHHEQVGLKIASSDEELAAVFRRHGVDVTRVLSIMREEGDLGLRQKLVDTLAYVVHDSRIVGIPLNVEFLWNVMRSVQDIRDGVYHVDDGMHLVALLECRAALWREFYNHPFNRSIMLLLAEAASWLIREDRLSPRTIVNGTDEQVMKTLGRAVREGAPAWITSIFHLASGKPTELRKWTATETDHCPAVVTDRPSFLLPAFDGRPKTLLVQFPNGTRATLTAPPERMPAHLTVSHTLTYSGPI